MHIRQAAFDAVVVVAQAFVIETARGATTPYQRSLFFTFPLLDAV